MFHAFAVLSVIAVSALGRGKGSFRRVTLLVALICAQTIAAELLASGFGVLRCLCWELFLYVPVALLAFTAMNGVRGRSWVWAAIALGIGALACDALLVEPRWLETTHVSVASAKVDKPLRIAVISDIQMDSFGSYEREALARVMNERPDLIVWPGDYVQARAADREGIIRSLRAELAAQGFDAPLGMYAVQGNMEGPGWERIWEGTKVRPLGRSERVETDRVVIEGLTLAQSFDARLQVGETSKLHVVVGHAPDFAMGEVHADLLLAGHTHGGQVRLPFYGPLLTYSHVPRAWAAGTTMLEGGRTLVVSRGVGMERADAPRIRFLCRPQLVIVDIVPR